MAHMTVETDREKHRRPTGQFGQHEHTAPEQTLNAPTAGVVVSAEVVHNIDERGVLGRIRTRTHILSASLRVHAAGHDEVVEGERGERIVSGHAYLPALRDGVHAPADQAALTTLGQYAAVRLPKLTGTVEQATRQADYYLNQHPRPGVIIDGMLWIRASEAARTHF